jgi:hypothetical protein
MNNNDAADLIDRLTAQLPTTDAPVAHLVTAGRSARRRRRRSLTAGAAVLAAAVTATAVLVPSLIASDPRPDVLGRQSAHAVVYFLAVDPDDSAEHPFPTRLVARLVDVHDTGDPGLDALHALQNAQPDDAELTNGVNFLRTSGESFIQAASVSHTSGRITVDLTADPWDPYPTADFGGPSGDAVAQELVFTVQTALDSSDPVTFTVNGQPVRGILGTPLPEPIAAQPNLLLSNPAGVGDAGAVPMTVSPVLVAPGQVVTVTYATDWTRGIAYKLVPSNNDEVPDPDNPSFYLTSDGGSGTGALPWYPADDAVGWVDIGIGGRGPDRVTIPDTAAAGTWLVCTANAATETCAEVIVVDREPPPVAPDVLDAISRPIVDEVGPSVSLLGASQGPSLLLSTHGSSSCPNIIDSVRTLDDETVLVTTRTLTGPDGVCTADLAKQQDQWPLSEALPGVRFAVIDGWPFAHPVRVAVQQAAPAGTG